MNLNTLKDDLNVMRQTCMVGLSLSKEKEPYIARLFKKTRENAEKAIKHVDKLIEKQEKKAT